MTRILHVLDHSLPLHSGYTFRTRAILRAQMAKGWAVRGITGHRHVAPQPQDGAAPLEEVVDGLHFLRTPGQPRVDSFGLCAALNAGRSESFCLGAVSPGVQTTYKTDP